MMGQQFPTLLAKRSPYFNQYSQSIRKVNNSHRLNKRLLCSTGTADGCADSYLLEVSEILKSKRPQPSCSRRVVVTGAGTISPLGNNIHDVFNRCLEGKSGLKSVEDYYVKDNDGRDWRDDYKKHGIHSISFIDEDDRLECHSVCGGKERMKSEAMM